MKSSRSRKPRPGSVHQRQRQAPSTAGGKRSPGLRGGGEIRARHYRTAQPIRIVWEDGRITRLTPADQAPADLWVAPALVDLQINGYAGIDFQQAQLSRADLLTATRALRADGCTRYLLTLITDAWPRLLDRLRHLRALRRGSTELPAAIAGWHVEGPFLSAEPGYRGAHNPSLMSDPTPAHLRQLREVVGDDRVLLTLAPERSGAGAAIQCAVALGFKVSLGHTNASAGVLADAVRAGATGFTHLGNGCPQLLDRHDNILWRVLETPGLRVSLIPDTIHVAASLFRLLHRVLRPEAIYYTTDAMAAAGAHPGHYQLGPLELEVGADQVVRLPGSENFAGSALRPIEGVSRAARMLGCSWREVWDRLSEIPAAWMELPAGLTVGSVADLCLVTSADGTQMDSWQVIRGGDPVSSRRGH